MQFEKLDTILYQSDKWLLTLGMLVQSVIVLIFLIGVWRISMTNWNVRSLGSLNTIVLHKNFKKYFRQLLLLLALLGIIAILHLDLGIYTTDAFILRISHLLIVALIFMFIKWINWISTQVIILKYNEDHAEELQNKYQHRQVQQRTIQTATDVIKYILLIIAFIPIIKYIGLDLLLYRNNIGEQVFDIRLSTLLNVVLTFLIAKLILWTLTNLILYRFYQNKEIGEGSQFAINQLIKYIVYVIAIFISLTTLGINVTLLLGGTAALLVGLGLGLQQTFNDFFSALVLLFERSVSVGDVLTIGEHQGTVKQIGLRASVIELLGNRTIVIPNSKLVSENVLNWNHFDNIVRFSISLGVAYGSNTKLVKSLLLKSLDNQKYILKKPHPFVRFTDFGDSALTFELFFYTKKLISAEDIKSDIRFNIDELFRINNIEIPFPQRQVWLKNT